MFLSFRRGDRATVNITDLVNPDGTPATFSAGDVLVWTMKADYGVAAANAIITKSSATGGITFTPGESDAAVSIIADDWIGTALRDTLPIVWDLSLLVGGDAQQEVTIAEGDGEIIPDVGGDPIDAATPTGGYYSGPSPWVPLQETLNDPRCVNSEGKPLSPVLIQGKIDVASAVLYRLSGRQFAGICTDTVRPIVRWHRLGIAPPWWWSGPYRDGGLGAFTTRDPHRPGGPAISLGAYPLHDIIEVRIDGQVIDPDTYRIDDRRWLTRIDPSGIGWPPDQDLSGDPATDPNTFQVHFRFGQPPDRGGVDSAKILAIELAKHASGDTCNLPERITSIQTPGMALAVLDPWAFLDKGRTGIYEVDLWLSAVNPSGLRRRSQVLSPNRQRPVRRTVDPVTGS